MLLRASCYPHRQQLYTLAALRLCRLHTHLCLPVSHRTFGVCSLMPSHTHTHTHTHNSQKTLTKSRFQSLCQAARPTQCTLTSNPWPPAPSTCACPQSGAVLVHTHACTHARTHAQARTPALFTQHKHNPTRRSTHQTCMRVNPCARTCSQAPRLWSWCPTYIWMTHACKRWWDPLPRPPPRARRP